ncbi:hypothetical protein GE061_017828 [Apolygus lucorum]|uniref:Fatty acyl-CoA reductase C-terminal domain-containing protein n=1 Tax=Apolygus lucorum TaxID=248454 RepID=A0A8S9XC93_APOLU|nr:hypothetical protein GE061_017828 [Apolygus lucorum]
MSKFLHLISYFSCKNWRFTHDNLTALWRGLSPTDKFLFDFDIANVDWEEIITTKVRGTRKYLFKEHEKTIPSAQKRRFRLLVIDRMLHAVLMLFMSNIIVKFIYKSLNT